MAIILSFLFSFLLVQTVADAGFSRTFPQLLLSVVWLRLATNLDAPVSLTAFLDLKGRVELGRVELPGGRVRLSRKRIFPHASCCRRLPPNTRGEIWVYLVAPTPL